MADPLHKSKSSSADMALWMGFADELQKIAAAATINTVTKNVKPVTRPPKMTSRPVVREPEPPSATLDHLSSTRSIQPPPVTMPGAN